MYISLLKLWINEALSPADASVMDLTRETVLCSPEAQLCLLLAKALLFQRADGKGEHTQYVLISSFTYFLYHDSLSRLSHLTLFLNNWAVSIQPNWVMKEGISQEETVPSVASQGPPGRLQGAQSALSQVCTFWFWPQGKKSSAQRGAALLHHGFEQQGGMP